MENEVLRAKLVKLADEAESLIRAEVKQFDRKYALIHDLDDFRFSVRKIKDDELLNK